MTVELPLSVWTTAQIHARCPANRAVRAGVGEASGEDAAIARATITA